MLGQARATFLQPIDEPVMFVRPLSRTKRIETLNLKPPSSSKGLKPQAFGALGDGFGCLLQQLQI